MSRTPAARAEAVATTVYVAISLLAVLMLFEQNQPPPGAAWKVLGTAVGLTAAHQLATMLADRYASPDGRVNRRDRRILAAQVAGGLAVGCIAAAPLVIMSGPASVMTSELVLLGILAGFAYASVRRHHEGRARSALHAAVVLGAAVAVLVVKRLVD